MLTLLSPLRIFSELLTLLLTVTNYLFPISLFVDETKLTVTARRHLELDSSPKSNKNGSLPNTNIDLRPYSMIKDFMQWLLGQDVKGKIWVYETIRFLMTKYFSLFQMSDSSSYALVNVVPDGRRVSEMSPIQLMKAIKNDVEIEGMKRAHIKDAVALCEYFAWLEDVISKGDDVTEISAADKLEDLRKYVKSCLN